MGMATITFTVHTDSQGRYVADVYVLIPLHFDADADYNVPFYKTRGHIAEHGIDWPKIH